MPIKYSLTELDLRYLSDGYIYKIYDFDRNCIYWYKDFDMLSKYVKSFCTEINGALFMAVNLDTQTFYSWEDFYA